MKPTLDSWPVYLPNRVDRKWRTGQKPTTKTFSQLMEVCPDGVMWTRLKLMIQRWNLKKSVIANMMVFSGGFVRHLCYRLALTNVRAMVIVAVGFVRYIHYLVSNWLIRNQNRLKPSPATYLVFGLCFRNLNSFQTEQTWVNRIWDNGKKKKN